MLTACSPVRRGVTGMTLDAAHRPTVAVAWCPGKPPNGITMWGPGSPAADDSDRAVTFRGPEPPGTYAEIPLTALPPGWTADPPAFTITPTHEYTVYAGALGNDYTTMSVHFTLEQLRPQGAARIRAWVGQATPSGDRYELLTVPEFKRLVDRDMCR